MERTFTKDSIKAFGDWLKSEEKSENTVEKYIRDASAFMGYLAGASVTKEAVIAYKNKLVAENYAVRSINSMLASLNSLFSFLGWHDCRVKSMKVQRQVYVSQERELTKAEYKRLLDAAKVKSERLYYLMQTICSTGIRISELRFITVEAVKSGEACLNCKGKRRRGWLPKQLCRMLREYTKKNNIKRGSVFITKTGKPLDRSNIWAEMKKLCKKAGVDKKKVFPHNLRHLFARVYYSREKDIVRLADILGHSSINTTRIYTMESGDVHRRQIERMGLLRC